jgi:hypothetical protein
LPLAGDQCSFHDAPLVIPGKNSTGAGFNGVCDGPPVTGVGSWLGCKDM